MSAIQVPEREFVNKFLTLATLNEPVLAPSYQKPLQEVNSLGVALPGLKYRYDPKRVQRTSQQSSAQQSGDNDSVILTLKSVRNPKFSVTQSFSKNVTVTQVKQYLVNDGKVEQVGQLKFLLKGKVLHDNILLLELNADEATVNVMISAPVPVEEQEPEIAQSLDDLNPEDESISSLQNLTLPWEDIEKLLKQKMSSVSEANLAIERLKKGWKLSE